MKRVLTFALIATGSAFAGEYIDALNSTGLVFYNSPAYRDGSEEHGVRRTSLFKTKDILGLSPEDFAQLALDIAALNLADDYETFMQNIDNENRARAIETYLDL